WLAMPTTTPNANLPARLKTPRRLVGLRGARFRSPSQKRSTINSMQKLTSFAEAHEALRQFYGKHAEGPYTLDRMRELMAYFGNPQDRLRIVPIAGTSGKTSTAYFTAALLQQ